MILPSKHLPHNRALLTTGAAILQRLTTPLTVSSLWEMESLSRINRAGHPTLRYDSFVLALDLLFLMGTIELNEGLIHRKTT